MTDVTFMAVGDVMLGRKVADVIQAHGPDFPFEHIRHKLSQADIAFGVFDAPVSKDATPNPAKPKGFPLLKCRAQDVDGLKNVPFQVMHIGTNHLLDYGQESLQSTMEAMDERGIAYIGAGQNLGKSRQPRIIERQGIRFGFLGYCMSYPADKDLGGCAPLKPEFIFEDLAALKDQVDIVIVSFHHGIEYSYYPYPEFRSLVHQVIERGAHLVLGHHTHVLQSTEHYKHGFVIYSLGNCVFDKDDKDPNEPGKSQLRTKLEQEGFVCPAKGEKFYQSIILEVIFDKRGIKDVRLHPIRINDQFQPVLAEGQEKEAIHAFLKKISDNLNQPLPQWKELSLLNAEENVQTFLQNNLGQLLKKFYRIRWRHIEQAWFFMMTKLKAKRGWGTK